MKKKLAAIALAAAMGLCGAHKAHAQYYSIINQGTNMLSTALRGGFAYRGLADVSYNRGMGDHQASFLEITTTQGVKYASWFYMGVGAGVDVMFAHSDTDYTGEVADNKGLRETACMIPLFTEFRFNIGDQSRTSFFAGVRVGASFLIGKDYVQIGDGYINRSECFYLKPTLGLRIPVNKSNSKQAVNIGASYTLVNTDYWRGYSSNITLNSLGISVGFEW